MRHTPMPRQYPRLKLQGCHIDNNNIYHKHTKLYVEGQLYDTFCISLLKVNIYKLYLHFKQLKI